MTDDNTEWGPWIEHDGKGCPVIGKYVYCIHEGPRGTFTPDQGIAGEYGAFSWDWQWFQQRVPGHDGTSTRIVCYRIRKPRGLRQLRKMVESLPAPEKETA